MIPVISGGQLRVAIGRTVYSWAPGAATVYGSTALMSSTPDLSDPDSVWRTQPSVRTVVGFLASNVAQIPLHGFRRSDAGRVRLASDDLVSVGLARPHPARTAYAHMFSLVVDVSMWERFAALKLWTLDGLPMLVRLPPHQWRFERDGLGLPTSVLWNRRDGQQARLPLDDVLFMDGHWSGVDGSPMEALKNLLTEQHESAEYRTQLWRGGARIPGVIERPADAPFWSTEGRQSFKDSWQAYAASGARAGKTPVLEDGMTYRDVKGVSPVDAQQLEARKLTIAEVAASFHVPPVFVGMLENANYSNVGAFRESLYSDVLGPKLTDIQQSYCAHWLPTISTDVDEYVEFAVGEKLKMAFEQQAQILQGAVGAPLMTRNEARQRMNLPAVEGGDVLIVPLNVGLEPAGVPGGEV